jgi:hypothetical protein
VALVRSAALKMAPVLQVRACARQLSSPVEFDMRSDRLSVRNCASSASTALPNNARVAPKRHLHHVRLTADLRHPASVRATCRNCSRRSVGVRSPLECCARSRI